jgi:hypothetical protein
MAMEPELDASDAVLDWQTQSTYEPRWSAARAEHFRARWRRAALGGLPADEGS